LIFLKEETEKMSTSDYVAMGHPYTAEEIEKMESDDVNRLAGGGGNE
jgi:hypothetical protein